VQKQLHTIPILIDWCGFYYFVRNSLVALLEALCARIFSWDSWITAAFAGLSESCQRGANKLDKTESPSKICMCGMSTQQWQSTQITLIERTRQSAWLDAVTIPLTRSEWILVNFLEGVQQPKKSFKNPENAPSNVLLMSRFQNFVASAAKEKTHAPCGFLKPRIN